MGAYLLSLPERILRSVSALAGGLVREIGDAALPEAFRRSRLYRSLVDTTLRFVIEQVGQVEGTYPTQGQLSSDFLLRRTAGNGLELIGVMTLSASPVWVFAALADLSGVGKELINRLSTSLQEAGLLESTGTFESMEQMLNGLEASSGRVAETFNLPPLDVASLRREWEALRAEVQRIPPAQLPSIAALTLAWDDLQSEAARQGRNPFEVSSAMALSAISKLPSNLRKLSKAARLTASRTGDLLAGGLLQHYSETLGQIRAKGFAAYWQGEFQPYLKAAAEQFSPGRATLTDRLWRKR